MYPIDAIKVRRLRPSLPAEEKNAEPCKCCMDAGLIAGILTDGLPRRHGCKS